MNETQQKLYELLIKFDGLCKKYNIVYFLGGGSALGALRHKGFLPWDDDVDMYISRDNYNKLIAVKNEFFGDDFILVNTDAYPRYRNTITRMVDTNSTVITKARIADGTPKGQFLELFILDPLPADESLHYDWYVKQWVYCELLSTTFRVANSRIYDYIDKDLYYKYRERCEKEGYDAVLKELENELFTIPESEATQYCCRWGLRHLIYDIDWFKSQRYVPFEDIELPVASSAESVLRFDYGDSWMYIPTVDNQITHSFADSMTIPYKEIVDDYSNFVDMDKVWDAYSDRKNIKMESTFVYREIAKQVLPYKQAQIDCSLEYNKKKYPNIISNYENGDFDAVLDFFRIYNEIQFSNTYWGRGTFLNISDEYLNIALAPFIVRGEYSKAIKLISFREKKGELSPELNKTKSFLYAVRDIYSSLDYNKHKEARQKLEYAKSIGYRFTDNQYNIRILTLKYALDDSEGEDINKVLDSLSILLSDYPDNSEVMYLIGEAYFKLGDFTSAQQWYKKSLEKLRHGFVIWHINERLEKIKEGMSND